VGLSGLFKPCDTDRVFTSDAGYRVMTSTLPILLPMDKISGLCRSYKVRELSLFGSALRKDFSPRSDIDLLVEFEPDARIGLVALSRMQRELEAILERKVDLVSKRGLKPLIRDEVLSQARVLYAA
jgi:predicted nucleotidyltransferase